VIQLEDRSVHAVAVLAKALADRQQRLERQADVLLPEGEHRLELVRDDTHVDV